MIEQIQDRNLDGDRITVLQAKNEELQEQLAHLRSENEALTSQLARQENNSNDDPTEDDDRFSELQGTILTFLDRIQTGFKEETSDTDDVHTLTSTSAAEIAEYQGELAYRSRWLEALLQETQREIKLMSQFYETMLEEEQKSAALADGQATAASHTE